MTKDIGIYTETMAKVYAAQGHWEKAAKIYRHLLSEEPARREIADALAQVEKRIFRDSLKDPEQLVPLFREWIQLMIRCENLKKLRSLKRKDINADLDVR
jgi:hypothetical protein